jgi:hypothetical protein
MRHTADETACLLAVILNRSGHNRARVSVRTIKFLAKRKTLRSAFASELKDALLDYGWVLVEIETGGFGAEKAKLLEAAKPVTAKRWLDDEIRRALRRREEIDAGEFARLEKEASPDEIEADEETD